MKLIVRDYEKENQAKQKKEPSRISNVLKKEVKSVFTHSRKEKKYYNLQILEDETHCKVSFIDLLNDGREVISKTTLLENKDKAISFVTRGIPKYWYKELPTRKVEFKLQKEEPRRKKEESKTITRPLGTDFTDWYKRRLQEFITLLDKYQLSYLSKVLEYRVDTYAKSLIVEFNIPAGKDLAQGNHKFLMKFDKRQYLYFFNSNLECKVRLLTEIFE